MTIPNTIQVHLSPALLVGDAFVDSTETIKKLYYFPMAIKLFRDPNCEISVN